MKQKILFCLFIILSFVFTNKIFAQSNDARERLGVLVEEMNKVLPISVQPGIIYKLNYFKEDSLFEVQEIDESVLPAAFASYRKNSNTIKNSLLRQYQKEPNLFSIAQLVVESNMNIVVLYVSKQSEKTFKIILSKDELEKCVQKYLHNNHDD